MSWVDNSIDKIVTFQRGFDLPKNDFKEGDFPVVGSTGVIGYHNEYKVKSPCIVTGRSGTLGVFQYLNEDFWAHNTTLWVKDFQGNHPKFIYYLLQILDFKSLNGGVAVPTLNRNVLKNVFISYPKSLQTQKRIASILSAYDDLIENNLKRIKILEETAQNIYKEWFVNFRFPNYENTPFNEETGLPEGWVILALKDIYNKLESGSRPKGGIDKDLKDGIPSIGAESIKELGYFDFSKTKFVSIDFFEKMNKGIIEDRDILIYKDGAYIGKTTLFQDDFPYTTCAVNEHVFLLNTKNKLQQYYLFFTLSSKEYYSKMQNLNSNAAQPGINQNKLLQLELSIPNKDKLLTDFNEKVEPLIRQIYSLAKINKKLKEARDILLPRLMNRTIEV
jgi:type I restriction enzyme S subunit